jgi:hypothetical protein
MAITSSIRCTLPCNGASCCKAKARARRISGKDPPQVRLAKDDDVIQAFAAQRARRSAMFN